MHRSGRDDGAVGSARVDGARVVGVDAAWPVSGSAKAAAQRRESAAAQ